LAYEAEVDRSHVGGLERKAENPTVDVLDRLAATLDVPLAELFKKPRSGASPPKPLRSGRRAAR
jgi:transcriptional regulator with XRE-family HTH domain